MKNLLVLIVIVISISGRAQTWNTQLVNPGNLVNQEAMVYDLNDSPILVYSKEPYRVYISKWNGTSWNTKNIANSVNSTNYPAKELNLAIKDSIIYVMVQFNNWHRLFYKIDSSLTLLLSMSLGNGVEGDGSICSSSADEILFARTNDLLYLKRFNTVTETWSGDELIDGSGVLTQPDITTANDGTIWITYKDDTGNNLKLAKSKTSGGWDIWFVDISGDVGDYPQIWIDNSNVAHIAYYDATNQKLKYATFSP